MSEIHPAIRSLECAIATLKFENEEMAGDVKRMSETIDEYNLQMNANIRTINQHNDAIATVRKYGL